MTFKTFLLLFSGYVPTLIVCLVAGVVILTKGRQAANGSLWASLGFGLAMVLCFAMPIGQGILQHQMIDSGSFRSESGAFKTLGIVAAVLQGVIYVLLLIAVFAGRSKADTATPAALNHPA